MKKQIITAVLLTAMVGTLCGCGPEPVTTSTTTTVSTTVESSVTSEETTTVEETTTTSEETTTVEETTGETETSKETTVAKTTKETKGKATKKDDTVWITKSGKKYHRKSNCGNMKKPTKTTIDKAEKKGLKPCKKCAG